MSKENGNNQLADAIIELTSTLKQMNTDINEIKNDVKVVKNNTSTILEKVTNLESAIKGDSGITGSIKELRDTLITIKVFDALTGRR